MTSEKATMAATSKTAKPTTGKSLGVPVQANDVGEQDSEYSDDTPGKGKDLKLPMVFWPC